MTPSVKLLHHNVMSLFRWITEDTADQALQPDVQSARRVPFLNVCRCVYVSMKHVFMCVCVCVCSKVCGCFLPPHVSTGSGRWPTLLPSHPVPSTPSVVSQYSVASQWAVLSVMPAHGPDSHHKASIVLTGWIGPHSTCHSAATCITRRHSGACFCFWFLLSG